MKVISVRQPWAWLIVATGECGKDIENRSWATSHRGPILIHAGAAKDRDFEGAIRYARERGIEVPISELRYGGIVGQARVVNCVRRSDSRWFMGDVGWVLADRSVLPFVMMPGKLSTFDAPADVMAALGLKDAPPDQYCFNPNI